MHHQQELSNKTIKWTGLLYLLVIICAGTSQGYIRGGLIIPNDFSATALNILQNAALFRLGLSLDLIAFTLDAIISVLLFRIFKSQGASLAMISMAFRLIAHPAIGSLNLLNHYLAIHVLVDTSAANIFETEQIQYAGALFMEAHRNGYLIAGGFFGVHLITLGMLLMRSDFPNILGVLLYGAAIGYLIETFGNFTFPGYEAYTALLVGFTAAIGELAFTFYLLFSKNKSLKAT
jgi:hypothetical protein